MSITRPSGNWLTVGELRAALADLDERTPVKIMLGGEEDTAVPVVHVTAHRFMAEIVVDAVDPSPLLDFVAEVYSGEYTLKQAKTEAADILRAAGYKVRA